MQRSNYAPQQQRPFLENDEYCSSAFTMSNSNYHYQLHHQQNQQQEQMFLQQIEPHPVPNNIQHQQCRNQLQGNFIPSLLYAQVEPGNPSPSAVFPMRLDIDQHGSKGTIADQPRNAQQYPPIFAPHPCNPQSNFISNVNYKQPFWKQLNTTDNKPLEKSNSDGGLEVMYGLVTGSENNNQTGSGSALTGENSQKLPNLSTPFDAVKVVGPTGGVDHGSENSIGEETLVSKSQKRIKKRNKVENLNSIAELFEDLVKKVIDNQESLHKNFLEVVDKMDKKRTEREEEWRRQESDKYNREAVCRQHEQALASNREALIISCIEKITGQSLNLPPRKTSSLDNSKPPTKESANCNNRWPKAEVEALIQVRTSIEAKFQQPGSKAPLWDEVSSLMGSMGCERSAKRCKEKWENINKYYKKSKESSKKRSSLSKTCSYFNQLDQIYPKNNSSFGKEQSYVEAFTVNSGKEEQASGE